MYNSTAITLALAAAAKVEYVESRLNKDSEAAIDLQLAISDIKIVVQYLKELDANNNGGTDNG